MRCTHLGWENTEDDVLCRGGNTSSKSLGNALACRGMNHTAALTSSFPVVSLGVVMMDEDGRVQVKSRGFVNSDLPHQVVLS